MADKSNNEVADSRAGVAVVPQMLSAHLRWLELGAREGTRAEFCGMALKATDFSNRKLDLAAFDRCDLTDASFDGADINGAKFTGCMLAGASFHRTTLRGASFSDCVGLTGKQFAAADLEGAFLPEPVSRFPNVARVLEISKRADALLVVIIGACVTSMIAITSASDASLLTNSGSLPLPGTTLTIPTATFAVAAPGALIALWLFLQLTLQHVWEEFADLPSVFPDGEARYRKAELWLLGSYVRSQSEEGARGAIGWLRLLTFHLLTSLLVPLMVVACWSWYLRRHDPIGTNILIAMITTSALVDLYFAGRARAILSPDSTRATTRGVWLLLIGVAAVLPLTLLFLSNAAMNGIPANMPDRFRQIDSWDRRLGQSILGRLHIRTNVRIRDVILPDYQKKLGEADLKHIDGYKLQAPSVDLRGAVVTGAFLDSATLTDAHLEGAYMPFASFSYAKLDGAFLEFTHFELSTAEEAHFNGAHMYRTWLTEADLFKADFSGADVQNVDFRGADLREAIFRNADLQGTDFYSADLRRADFTGAKNLSGIKCLSWANVAGTIGLEDSRVLKRFPVIRAEYEDDYRTALAQQREPLMQPCALDRTLGWVIEGPPTLRSWSIDPRSLRSQAIELPQQLPRYLSRAISLFLSVVQKMRAHDLRTAFEETRRKLGLDNQEGSTTTAKEFAKKFGILFAASPSRDWWRGPRSPLKPGVLLQGLPIVCRDGGAGFELVLSGELKGPTHLDIDAFINSELGARGEDLGVEQRWPLEKSGLLVRSKDDAIQYWSCPPSAQQ